MTEQEITALGPAFASYPRRFRGSLGQDRTGAHVDTYCRGLVPDPPRKSIEPVALEAGTAVRTLQEFLVTARWDRASARDTLQKHLGAVVAALPGDALGTVGVIDETSCRKWGDHTPGVRRQYLGCVGELENGIVTVHIGVTKGTFQVLLDADLFLPESWADDRDRCEQAGTPDDVGHQAKWRRAVDQWLRLNGNGWSFDWLVFDAGCGAAVPFLRFPNVVNQPFVAEVPVNVRVRERAGAKTRRADARLRADGARGGKRHRIAHRTVRASFWRAATAPVWVADREHTLVAAINEATGEVKYVVTNATTAPLARVLAVAFRRWTVEHAFRLGRQEAGLMDYEGRNDTGLVRHLTRALVVLGFVATRTERLRGENPAVTAEQVCRALNQRCRAVFRRRRGTADSAPGTPVASSATTRRATRRPPSHTRSRGINGSSRPALYC